MGWKHVLCMETVLCAAVGTASCRHGLEEHVLCMEALLCAAVGTVSHQSGLEARTVYGRSESKYTKSVPTCTTAADINILKAFI